MVSGDHYQFVLTTTEIYAESDGIQTHQDIDDRELDYLKLKKLYIRAYSKPSFYIALSFFRNGKRLQLKRSLESRTRTLKLKRNLTC